MDFYQNLLNLLKPYKDTVFQSTWSRDLPTVRFKTRHFVNNRNEKSRKN